MQQGGRPKPAPLLQKGSAAAPVLAASVVAAASVVVAAFVVAAVAVVTATVVVLPVVVVVGAARGLDLDVAEEHLAAGRVARPRDRERAAACRAGDVDTERLHRPLVDAPGAED